MLTEDEARELLRLAGDTVDVAPAGPLQLPPRRRAWPLLVAAAAVLVVAGLPVLVLGIGSHDDEPAVDHGRQVPRIPSVFDYRTGAATAMLTDHDLRVRVTQQGSCEPAGRVLGVRPGAGTPYSPGDNATLVVSSGPPATADCFMPGRAEAWAFLDFANGRGPAPAFAERVALWVDGERTATLTAAQASDPGQWGEGSALQRLAADSRRVTVEDGRYATPVLTSHPDDGTQFVCGGQGLPPALAGRASELLYVSIPTHGVSLRCAFVNVFRTGGRIDTVVLRTDAGPRTGSAGRTRVPDLVGREIGRARADLRADGLTARVEHGAASNLCLKDERVISQDPSAGSSVPPGSSVTLRTRWRLCGQPVGRQ